MDMTSELLTLAQAVGSRLQAARWMLATAESCTGGGIATALTEIPGSSRWFDRGYITYSDAAKVEMLGVSEATLATWGAVSEETALEMARGALERSRGHLAVSATGIAGPGGATPAKPVGTVCIGWATPDGATAATCRFEGDRGSVRTQTVAAALKGLLARLP